MLIAGPFCGNLCCTDIIGVHTCQPVNWQGYSQTEHGLWFSRQNIDVWWYAHISNPMNKHDNSSHGTPSGSSSPVCRHGTGGLEDVPFLSVWVRESPFGTLLPLPAAASNTPGCALFAWPNHFTEDWVTSKKPQVLDLVAEAVANVTTLKVWMLWMVGTCCGMLSCHVNCSVVEYRLDWVDWPENLAGCHILKARLLGWTRPTTTFCQSLGLRTCKLQRVRS